jgi:hypothetical protein
VHNRTRPARGRRGSAALAWGATMSNPPQGGDEQRNDAGQPTPQSSQQPWPEPGHQGWAQPGQAPPGYPPPPVYGPPPGYPPPQVYGPPPGYGPQSGYGQQGYGQQGYGQPYASPGYGQQPPAPKKKHTGLIIALSAVVVAAAVAVVLSLVLGPRVLSRSAVQRDVAAQFEQHEGVTMQLRCDQRMKVADHATYTCEGTTADGDRVPVTITVTDAAKARYTWSAGR